MKLNKGLVSQQIASEIRLKKKKTQKFSSELPGENIPVRTKIDYLIPQYIQNAVTYLKDKCEIDSDNLAKKRNVVGNSPIELASTLQENETDFQIPSIQRDSK